MNPLNEDWLIAESKDSYLIVTETQHIAKVYAKTDESFKIAEIIANSNINNKALEVLKKLRGIEAWIGDDRMKQLFQKEVYGLLDSLK